MWHSAIFPFRRTWHLLLQDTSHFNIKVEATCCTDIFCQPIRRLGEVDSNMNAQQCAHFRPWIVLCWGQICRKRLWYRAKLSELLNQPEISKNKNRRGEKAKSLGKTAEAWVYQSRFKQICVKHATRCWMEYSSKETCLYKGITFSTS